MSVGLVEVCKLLIISWISPFLLYEVPVIVLFTKADMLDAQTIEQLVDAGMNVEDAAIKAPEESVARFEKKFGQQLYKKKYPPKGHVYFRGATNALIYSLQINCI